MALFCRQDEVQHIVPLSRQAIEILQAIRPLTGFGRYEFPSSRGDGRHDKDRARIRTTPSMLLSEQGWSPDAIERQFCHMPRDAVRAVYNRGQYLDERRKMVQA